MSEQQRPPRSQRRSALCVLCGLCVLLVSTVACGGATSIFRQYEYEEEVYLSLDGTATVYVNSSLAALERAARHVVRREPDRARRCAGDPRVLRQPDDARDARQPVAPQRPPLRPRAARRRRRAPARRGGAVRVVDVRASARRRLFIYRQTVGGFGRQGRRGPAAGTAGRSSRSGCTCRARSATTTRGPRSAATSSSGSSRSPTGCAASRCMLEARMDPQSILYRTLWLFGIDVHRGRHRVRSRDLVGHASGEIDQ